MPSRVTGTALILPYSLLLRALFSWHVFSQRNSSVHGLAWKCYSLKKKINNTRPPPLQTSAERRHSCSGKAACGACRSPACHTPECSPIAPSTAPSHSLLQRWSSCTSTTQSHDFTLLTQKQKRNMKGLNKGNGSHVCISAHVSCQKFIHKSSCFVVFPG